MWQILRGEPEAIISHGRAILCGGMALIGISLIFDGHGLITGMFAGMLGAAGQTFHDWRTERGLWMLAALFFLMNAFIYACFCVGQAQDALRGAVPNDPAFVIDVSIGTLLLALNLRFLFNVVKVNYLISSSQNK